MSLFDRVIEEIDRGKLGLNEGLPHGFPKLVDYIPNVQKKTYYLIGASTGEGKTTIADQMFLYSPYEYIKNTIDCPYTIDIDYFSFEIDSVSKITKGISRKLYLDYGLVVDVNYILSRGKNMISQEIYDKIILTKNYFEELEDNLHIFDIALNPTGVNKYLFRKAEEHGKILKKIINTVDDNKNPVTMEVFDKYVPNNPNRFWIVILDHAALLREELGKSTKQLIDKMSEYLVAGRNNFGITPVVIQQLNYDINSPERAKIGRLTPMLSDFGDSKYTTRDCNYCLSLFNPSKFEQSNFRGYDISKLGDRFRSVEILKGRDGGIGTRIGLAYLGAVGVYKELPKAEEMRQGDYQAIINYDRV